MMPIQMRIWSEAITASEFCLLFDSHKMAIFNIRLLHIRLCLRPTSAIPCIKFSAPMAMVKPWPYRKSP